MQKDIQISWEKLSLVLSLKWIEMIFNIMIMKNKLITQWVFTCANSTWRHRSNVWNLNKVNNKGTRTTSMTLPLTKLKLLTLNRFHTLFWCFHCWLWTSKCPLGRSCTVTSVKPDNLVLSFFVVWLVYALVY